MNHGAETRHTMAPNRAQCLRWIAELLVNHPLARSGGMHNTPATGPFASTPRAQATAEADHHHRFSPVPRPARYPVSRVTVVHSVSSVSMKTKRPEIRNPR